MKRECPKCNAAHDCDALMRSADWELTCSCGALLRLEWERIETDNGPEDCYWFEVDNRKGMNEPTEQKECSTGCGCPALTWGDLCEECQQEWDELNETTPPTDNQGAKP